MENYTIKRGRVAHLRLTNVYKIIDREGKMVSFHPNARMAKKALRKLTGEPAPRPQTRQRTKKTTPTREYKNVGELLKDPPKNWV